jgi:YVTN family beta-propeller protein
MWASSRVGQLWVNNDVDNTITVIDTITLEVITTVPLPADLVDMGGKPHDVVLDPVAPFAYVTMLGLEGPNDYVVKFDTGTFTEVARAPVGQDPHVSLNRQNGLLYVPCQNSDAVFVLERDTLDLVSVVPFPGAHGAGMTKNGKVLYSTNLPGGGTDGLFTVDTRGNQAIAAADTPFPVPHNVAMTPNGKKIYVTHSGATSDRVTVYLLSEDSPVPELLTTVTTGRNPFGLAFVP